MQTTSLMADTGLHLCNRGGVMVTKTISSRKALFGIIAKSFNSVLKHIATDPLDQSIRNASEKLDIASLKSAMRMQATAIPEFSDLASMDRSGVQEVQKLFNGVVANSDSLNQRSIREMVDKHVRGTFENVKSQLLVGMDVNTPKMREQIANVRRRLKDSALVPATFSEVKKLNLFTSQIHEFARQVGKVTGEVYENGMTSLVEAARKSAQGALSEIIAELVRSSFEANKTRLLKLLDELDTLVNKFASQTDAMTSNFKSALQQQITHEQELSGNTQILLSGHAEQEVENLLRNSVDANDELSLTDALAKTFLEKLKTHVRSARKDIPDNQSICKLLTSVPIEDSCRVFSEMIMENVNGHAIYNHIHDEGEENIARLLFDRGAPTVSFGGRDHRALGLTVVDIAIARLPIAHSPEEEDLKNRLKDAFLKVDGNIFITEGNENDQEVCLTRLNLGWPVGIDASNSHLFRHYLDSAKQGHPPHLLNVLPESPNGTAIESF